MNTAPENMAHDSHHLSAETIADLPEEICRHHIDGNAVVNVRTLSNAVGLQRLGAHLVRLQPGRAASELHFHHHEEEFVYVIAGRGRAELGHAEQSQEVELRAGDFIGFPNDGVAHRVHNPYNEDLYFLVAGERAELDVCDYPRAGKRLVRYKGGLEHTTIPNDE